MSTIVKLHGTSGSGKSTVAKYILQQGIVTPHPTAYEINNTVVKGPIYVLGLYNTACGGCDTLTAGQQIHLIQHYAQLGNVFYEGLLSSEYYGKLGVASEPYGKSHVFAFLDTPIEVCIERVKARRLAAGNMKPLNETNTRDRVDRINRLKVKLLRDRRRVVDINYMNANQEVYDLFKE